MSDLPKRCEWKFFGRRSPMEQKDETILLLMRRIANYPINAKEKRATEKSRADAQLLRCDESGRRLFGKERGAGARG